MANQAHPLMVENWGGDVYIVGSKGHHDPDEFMRQVHEDGFDWPLGKPQHEWLKAVPNNSDGGTTYAVCAESTRGAFPATVAREAYGEDAYKAPGA